jgi:hypothetical protein
VKHCCTEHLGGPKISRWAVRERKAVEHNSPPHAIPFLCICLSEICAKSTKLRGTVVITAYLPQLQLSQALKVAWHEHIIQGAAQLHASVQCDHAMCNIQNHTHGKPVKCPARVCFQKLYIIEFLRHYLSQLITEMLRASIPRWQRRQWRFT